MFLWKQSDSMFLPMKNMRSFLLSFKWQRRLNRTMKMRLQSTLLKNVYYIFLIIQQCGRSNTQSLPFQKNLPNACRVYACPSVCMCVLCCSLNIVVNVDGWINVHHGYVVNASEPVLAEDKLFCIYLFAIVLFLPYSFFWRFLRYVHFEKYCWHFSSFLWKTK